MNKVLSRLIFHNLTIRNFWSIGNVTQDIVLDSSALTLVLGRNTDTSQENSRNGVGKTALLQAIYYVLFGDPLNTIKLDNLVNNQNLKGMLVTITFSSGGVEYRIERGRKPNVMKFFINEVDQAQGENKNTQADIERILGMSGELFKHIVGLNMLTDPFLKLKAADQREIIEELLGIAQLSERAAVCKSRRDATKETLRDEESKLNADKEANQRISDLIGATKQNEREWNTAHQAKVNELTELLLALGNFDFDAENAIFDEIDVWERSVARISADEENAYTSQQSAKRELSSLDAEIQRTNITSHQQSERSLAILKSRKSSLVVEALEPILKRIDVEINRNTSGLKNKSETLDRLLVDLEQIDKKLNMEADEHQCPTCNQGLSGSDHLEIVLSKLRRDKSRIEADISSCKAEMEGYSKQIDDLTKDRELRTTEHQKKVEKNNSDLQEIDDQIEQMIETIKNDQEASKMVSESLNIKRIGILENIDLASQRLSILRIERSKIGEKPSTQFSSRAEIASMRHSQTLTETELTMARNEVNPHTAKIDTLSLAIKKIDRKLIDELTRLLQHQDFLLKLLTSKDSFVRKRIIDRNLAYLNNRITHYAEEVGLPHYVAFQSDLSVNITLMAKDYDFAQLSRGEQQRLILSMSFAFRDMWEGQNRAVNLLFVDEVLDVGMDEAGADAALKMMTRTAHERNRNMFLISHKEHLVGRADTIMVVHKQNGFTSFEQNADPL